jgi:hypothetical protein
MLQMEKKLADLSSDRVVSDNLVASIADDAPASEDDAANV